MSYCCCVPSRTLPPQSQVDRLQDNSCENNGNPTVAQAGVVPTMPTRLVEPLQARTHDSYGTAEKKAREKKTPRRNMDQKLPTNFSMHRISCVMGALCQSAYTSDGRPIRHDRLDPTTTLARSISMGHPVTTPRGLVDRPQPC